MKIVREFRLDVLVKSEGSDERSIGEVKNHRQADSLAIKWFSDKEHIGDLIIVRPYYRFLDMYGSFEYHYRVDGKGVLRVTECEFKL